MFYTIYGIKVELLLASGNIIWVYNIDFKYLNLLVVLVNIQTCILIFLFSMKKGIADIRVVLVSK